MNVSAVFVNTSSRFNAMSLRERGLIAAALLGLVILLWNQWLMKPLQVKQLRLTQEIGEIEKSRAMLTDVIEGRANDNPLKLAMEQKQQLTQTLTAVDSELQSVSAGLIAPQRMLAVLRDVLNGQQGLRLVSMRNLPVTSLAAPMSPQSTPPASTSSTPATDMTALRSEINNLHGKPPRAAQPVAATGPYVHSLELVIDGSYLDVLRYLQSVEALSWRFYWQVLELRTTEYPINRVRIRLNTLSMDKEWLGV